MAQPQTHFDFGIYRINLNKLKTNILSVSTQKKSHVLSVVVGTKLRDILLDHHYHRKFNLTDYNNLEKDQKIIMNDLLKRSGMDDRLGIRITNDELDKMMDRYNLVKGEIMAGNDARELRTELKHLVIRLVKLGFLPPKKSNDLLMELLLLEHWQTYLKISFSLNKKKMKSKKAEQADRLADLIQKIEERIAVFNDDEKKKVYITHFKQLVETSFKLQDQISAFYETLGIQYEDVN